MVKLSAFNDTVTSVPGSDVTLLAPTNHEEADTRVFLHTNDMSQKGFASVMIRTVDTDVLNLALSFCKKLQLEKLWVDFGTGKQRCFLPVHEMVLNPAKVDGLPFFMAVTACDQVDFFCHVSKTIAWKVWTLFPKADKVFAKLSRI